MRSSSLGEKGEACGGAEPGVPMALQTSLGGEGTHWRAGRLAADRPSSFIYSRAVRGKGTTLSAITGADVSSRARRESASLWSRMYAA
jgi:hypothetical protein